MTQVQTKDKSKEKKLETGDMKNLRKWLITIREMPLLFRICILMRARKKSGNVLMRMRLR